MKPQTTKKLFAFIIMMFSISFLQAQCPCKPNQVLMAYHHIRTGLCSIKCVSEGQVKHYVALGWCDTRTFTCCILPLCGTTNKSSEKTPADNAIVSNKIFRK